MTSSMAGCFTIQEIGPGLHELTTSLKRICAPVGPLDGIAADVSKRGLTQLVGKGRRVGRPRLEA